MSGSGETRPEISALERIGSRFLSRISTLRGRDISDLAAYRSNAKAPEKGLAGAPRSYVVGGFEVSQLASPAMGVQVGLGMGFAQAANQVSPVGAPQETSESSYFVMLNKRLVTANVAINAAHASLVRFDLIELAPAASPATEVDEKKYIDLWDDLTQDYVLSVAQVPTMRHGEPDVIYTAGTPGGGIPAPTPGRLPIAAIIVRASTTSILTIDILDLRIFEAEIASSSRSKHSGFINVAEFSIDVPDGAVANSVFKFSCLAEVRAGGIPGAFRANFPSFLNLATAPGDFETFADTTTVSLIAAGTSPAWLYAYIVASDDQGYRLSSSTPTTNAWQSVGTLVFSHVPPSLVSESMAPSAALHLPALYGGNGLCTPGVGKAICIAAIPYVANAIAADRHFAYGIRMRGGRAEFVSSGPAASIATSPPTFTAESAGTTAVSRYYSLWGNSNPIGPVSFDVYFGLLVANSTTHKGRQRSIWIAEDAVTGGNVDRVAAYSVTTVEDSAIVAGNSLVPILAKGLAVGRVPGDRGASKTGFDVRCTVVYGVSGSGAGLADPSISPPVITLVGYTWPQGACVA